MGHPIVIAHHLIWTAYGWWLPNDPRGSTSQVVRCDVLGELGKLHVGRKIVQPAGWEVRGFYDRAAEALKHALLTVEGAAAIAVADGFAQVIAREKYTCWACAIMPDHVHMILRKHKHAAEAMIWRLQESSRLRLSGLGLRAMDHPVWSRGGWKVFLDHPEEVWRTMRYVERNPDALSRKRQDWGFVAGYDHWPLHEGHCGDSPYARALRTAGRYSRDDARRAK